MSEPRIPDPSELPALTQKSLVIHWDAAENAVWMDTSGFSVLEVATLLRIALDVAELELPTPYYVLDDEEEDD